MVFGAEPTIAQKIPEIIAANIESTFGYRVPVVSRAAEDLRAIPHSNPFIASGAEVATLHVAFLSDLPSIRFGL